MSNEIKQLNFTLFDLERTIAQRDYNEFENLFATLLTFIDNRSDIESTLHIDENGKTTCSHIGLSPFSNQLSYNQKVDLYSRLAATITAYLSDTTYTPRDDFLIRLVVYKNHIMNIFYLSCYSNTDHILFNRGLSDKNNALQLKTDQDIKFLYACLSLNSNIEFDVDLLVNAIPLWGMYWYFGLLYGQHHPYNSQIEKNLNKVIDAHTLIQTMVFDDTTVELSASPWMLCSYFDRSDRHEIKKSINVAIEKWIKGKQLAPGLTKKISRTIENTTEVKKVVVLSEKYTTKHAMYRSYHAAITELKNHFDVTFVSSESDYDDVSKQDFINIVHVQDAASSLESNIKVITDLKPDLILYPSLGMAKWTLPLCNMKLAKYQVMSYGHPASAFSNYIDYGITSGFPEGPDYQNFLQEKLIITSSDIKMTKAPKYNALERRSKSDNVVRIAVNSSVQKITTRFINLCILLQQHSTVPLEFHFFLIQQNTAFKKSIIERLGLSTVIHQPKPYMEYMETLAQCDLAIGTFPFGGANTNIDLALLGIPKIFFTEGSNLASYTDICINQKLSPPAILHASSEAQLLSNAIYLIHDHVERGRLSDEIKAKDIENLFFKHNDKLRDHMYIDAIKSLTSVVAS